MLQKKNKYMLFAGWEVRIVKSCDRGLENAARGLRPRAAFSSPRSQFFTIRTDPKPVNNLFIFFQALKRKKTHGRKLMQAFVTVTVVKDWKIRTALRTNQIAGFVSVPAWKNINTCYLPAGRSTSFPVSLILPPPGASEERPWHRLVTCLPESGRWQLNYWRDGRPSRSFVYT